MHFRIAPERPDAETASVQDATVVESTRQHPLMESCVSAVFSTLTFEVPEGGQLDVNYPIVLRATEAEAPAP